MADVTVEELAPEQQHQLARFIDSPEFEHLTLQMLLAHRKGKGSFQDEIWTELRHEIRQSLRHAMDLPGDRLYGVTSLVFNAMVVACESALAELRAVDRLGAIEVASRAHVAAMAARNGRLLSEITNLGEVWRQGEQLRAQVVAAHAVLRLLHTGSPRSVPWQDLYVPHTLFAYQGTGEPVPFEPLLGVGERAVILGDPGAGKSTLATKIAYEVAGERSGRVPFLMTLREFSGALKAGERTLVQQLALAARNPYNVDMTAEAVEYFLLNGRGVVILDGLDELVDVALRRRVVLLVQTFTQLYPLTPMIVTSRRIGYAEAALDPSLFRASVIGPFDDEQVRAYAGNWFRLEGNGSPAQTARLLESFLRESAPIHDLRQNPLLLSLLCAMYAAEQYIPGNRAQIYERCALMVFDRWDRMRGVEAPTQFDARIRGAIPSLAWSMFAELQVTELPRYKVARLLTRFLVDKRFEADEAAELAEDFLKFCAGRAWVLTEVGATATEAIYGFTHRTFMEYFAAEHLVRHHPSPADVWQILVPRISEGLWSVVAHLSLQLIERNIDDGAETLLTLALADYDTATDSRRHRLALFLAQSTGHVALSPVMLEKIATVCLDMVRSFDMTTRLRHFTAVEMLIRSQDTDAPMAFLLDDSLTANYRLILRTVEAQLQDTISRGDENDMTLASVIPARVKDNLRREQCEQMCDRLFSMHADQVSAWRERQPWGWFPAAGRGDPDALDAVLTRFGAAAFYLGYAFMGGGVPPLAASLPRHRGPDGRSAAWPLVERLLRRPAPWIGQDRWLDEAAETRSDSGPWEITPLLQCAESADGLDIGLTMILLLPYLEHELAEGEGQWERSTAGYPQIVAAAREPGKSINLKFALGTGVLTDEWAHLLDRWARREVSLVGRPGVADRTR